MKAFLLLFVLTTPIFSNEISREDCIEEARIHGGMNSINEQCFEKLKTSEDITIKGKFFEITAMENILWIKNKDEELVKIAGDNSQLEQVFSVLLDEKKEVAILFKDSREGVEIIVHHLSSHGNVAPFIKKTFSQLTPQMTYLYDQERSLLLVEEQGIKVAVLFFDWREELVRLGRAKIIELNDLPTIP